MRRLREMQDVDGSWKNGWFCKYGSSEILVGNEGLTTALAVRALDAFTRNDKSKTAL